MIVDDNFATLIVNRIYLDGLRKKIEDLYQLHPSWMTLFDEIKVAYEYSSKKIEDDPDTIKILENIVTTMIETILNKINELQLEDGDFEIIMCDEDIAFPDPHYLFISSEEIPF